MQRLLNFFKSIKLALVIISLITISSVFGTLVPQQRPPAEYFARYGSLAQLLIRLKITNLYHSFWFIGLLFIFSLNIITCTLIRLMPKLRRILNPQFETEQKNLQLLKISKKIRKNWSVLKAKEELRGELRLRHYRVREREGEGKIFIIGRKRLLGAFGSDIVHLGLLIILAGGILSGLGGFRENLILYEQEVIPVPRADFKIRLEKFETEFYANGSVKDWKSTLTVLEKGAPQLNKVIEVNHPLSYKGLLFYQSSYGLDWESPSLELLISNNKSTEGPERISLEVGERVRLWGGEIEIKVTRFVPDFMIDENKQIRTRSLQPNNPAAFIEGWKDGQRIFSGWVFSRFPDFASLHQKNKDDLKIEITEIRARQFSVIQVARDPGTPLIWTGCAFLMMGLMLAFYWPIREIKAILEQEEKSTEIAVGALSSKNKEALEAELNKIFDSLRRRS